MNCFLNDAELYTGIPINTYKSHPPTPSPCFHINGLCWLAPARVLLHERNLLESNIKTEKKIERVYGLESSPIDLEPRDFTI